MTLSPEQFLTVTRAFRPLPTADGGLVFGSDLAGHPQVYRLPRPGRWPERLAPSGDRVHALAEVEGGLLLRHDQGGNETWQLSLLAADGGLRRLTQDAKAIHQSVTPAPDRERVGLGRNPGGQVDFHLSVLDLEAGRLEDWLRRDGFWLWAGWRPDGKQATCVRMLSPTRLEGYLLDPDGTLTPVLPAARRAIPRWAPDGRLYAETDFESEFVGLAEVDPAQPREPRSWLLHVQHDLEAFVPDPSGRSAAVALNQGPYDQLSLLDLTTGRSTPLKTPFPGIVYTDNVSPADQNLAWSPDGRRLFAAWEGPTRPADVYELRRGTRWTQAGTELGGCVEPQETDYRSFDGLEIPALHFFRRDGRPRPTLVWFHGGPEGQLRAGFNQAVQMLVAHGIDVFAPNVRGSTGYGVRYFSLDDKELRWDSVRDGVEAGRHLKATGAASRLAAMGGSYGGFMTLAVLIEDPELWDAAVELVGISDWHSFFRNTSGWRRAVRAAEYGDPEGAEAEVLAEFSPLRRAHVIRAPLLVIHGRNDVRVPVSEAEQISQAAREAELVIFDDEGHGIVKHVNRVKAYSRALSFLTERLGLGGSADAAGSEPPG
ncbi:MAG TPA: prolyl oligopeptidase family serine peptidase [Candidatus Acidoferrales bacterium]|nr:prolyl oligopeptidase family serine peptidase [Candidatus Acidoferrales bacterium]